LQSFIPRSELGLRDAEDIMIEKETYMKTIKLAMGFVGVLLLTASAVLAEDKTPPPDVPLRMTVVFNEYDGSKKIASLPYVMPCKASSRRGDTSVLRIGFDVPYKTKQDEVNYRNVGTNIDCWSTLPDERGGFMVDLGVEHNGVYSPKENPTAVELQPGMLPGLVAPITGGIRANLQDLLIHDSQTVEALTATDPVSGHVWKVEVTLNIVK
jgi:hypothetical protein